MINFRVDGWANYLTGLGTMARDKLRSHAPERQDDLDTDTLDDLWQGDDLAAAIVSKLPTTAMRQGFDLVDTSNATADQSAIDASRLMAECRRLDVAAKVTEAAIWGRLFGGAGIMLGVAGSGEPAMPLRDDRAARLLYLTVLDKRDITPNLKYTQLLDAAYGEIASYLVTPGGAQIQDAPVLHETRFMRFPGALTTRTRRHEIQGWDDSVIRKVYAVLQAANSNWQSVSHLMTDASQAVYKLKGLSNMVAGNYTVTLQQRMEAIELGRSAARAILLDADGEEFNRIATSFAGMPEILQQTWQRVATAANVPLTVLFKMSPGGLNATGESDLEIWYGDVQEYRETVLQPRLSRLVRLCARNLNETDPNRWCIRFPPLRPVSAKDRAALELDTARKDEIYMKYKAVSASETALSRFGSGAWSPDTVIDNSLREGRAAIELSGPVKIPAKAP